MNVTIKILNNALIIGAKILYLKFHEISLMVPIMKMMNISRRFALKKLIISPYNGAVIAYFKRLARASSTRNTKNPINLVKTILVVPFITIRQVYSYKKLTIRQLQIRFINRFRTQ